MFLVTKWKIAGSKEKTVYTVNLLITFNCRNVK